MLAAGLEGIEKGYELAPEAVDNIYHMTEAERTKAGIDSLPKDLNEAIEIAEGSELLKKALGEHVHEYFIRNKKAEALAYNLQVSQFELDSYLSSL
jgi:glutamine synthetase